MPRDVEQSHQCALAARADRILRLGEGILAVAAPAGLTEMAE